jgi:hypothetical protein
MPAVGYRIVSTPWRALAGVEQASMGGSCGVLRCGRSRARLWQLKGLPVQGGGRMPDRTGCWRGARAVAQLGTSGS